MRKGEELKVGIGGFGSIGRTVARALDRGIPGLVLGAVSARDRDKAEANLEGYARKVPVVGLGELPASCDLIVECAPAAVFDEVATAAIEAGKLFMPLSVGALLPRQALIERARQTGARIIVPSGALLGLDAVRAAAEGTIHSVRMITRKPPLSLEGAPYLKANNIDLNAIDTPTRIFEGTAREGAAGFPANVNVAAALSLAGIGPDLTRLEIWADPSVSRNIHQIVVEADSARFELKIENVPSEENPRTGKITALSVIAALRGLGATLRVGT